ncbi:hypothetical protein CC2G_013069 [Coprinopsis cinerea AmutBmut pab1-1]|nr:hypothetical protein CC2G_013069 [Coprinopsis cinerea AmutBmut pab1-1]
MTEFTSAYGPPEHVKALEKQLESALEAEQEALWWADTASSDSALLLYILQSLPSRLANIDEESLRKLRSPLKLARQECAFHLSSLERIRDERAEQLGLLALQPFYPTVAGIKSGQISTQSEQKVISTHRRPSALAQLWPKIFLNTVLLYSSYSLARYGYNQRHLVREWLKEGREALKGLVQGWVLEPLKDVWNTIRASEDMREGLVRRQGVLADIESLERMALSLAKDVLHYNDTQLELLRVQVNQGDLTPLMELYENDIRSPLKSALAGTLVRGILIQVQKAKVDIDQALTGIDHLLKSQQLTFAFVGVAPALITLYIVSQTGLTLTRMTWALGRNLAKRAWSGTKTVTAGVCTLLSLLGLRTQEISVEKWAGQGVIGELSKAIFGNKTSAGTTGKSQTVLIGKVSLRQAWADLRRVERLLIRGGTPKDEVQHHPSPLSTGLILLSLARLRVYGNSLPVYSPLPGSSQRPLGRSVGTIGLRLSASSTRLDLRGAFLEDLNDLADPSIAREDKLRVVSRMWRCFAGGVAL